MVRVEQVALARLPSWVGAAVSRIAPTVRRHLSAAGHKSVNAIHETIAKTRPFPPVDRGAYRASWKTEERDDGVLVFSDAPHAAFIERGTRPHWPPPGPIEAWVRRKKLAKTKAEQKRIAFQIRLAIARRGTRPRKVLERTMGKILQFVDEAVRDALAEAVSP